MVFLAMLSLARDLYRSVGIYMKVWSKIKPQRVAGKAVPAAGMLLLSNAGWAAYSPRQNNLTEFVHTNITLLNLLLLLLCALLAYRLLKSRLEILNIRAIDFHALADNAQDGIFIVQHERLVYANLRSGEILGYSNEQLLNRQLADIVHPDNVELVLDRHQRRIRGEEVSKQYEVNFLNIHNNTVPVELTAALTSWQGQPAVLVIIRDITERKLIEKTLQDSEKRYRSLVENSPDAILIIDAANNCIIEVNEQVEKLFKFSKHELFSMSPEELSRSLPAGREQKPLSHYIERALHGQPLIFERDFVDSTGQILHCEIRLSRMPFPNRKLIRGSIIDVTQRRLYQSALARSEERLASFFQASFETLFFHDNGIIKDANDVAEHMFGHKKEDVIGHHVLEFVAPESQPLARDNMRNGLDGPYELTALHKNGTHFPVQVQAKTLQLDKISQRIVSVVDLSNLKQATEKLKESENNLQSIFDNMIDTFYRTDSKGKILMVSPSVKELLGYQPEQLIGTDIAKLYADSYGRDFFMGTLQAHHGQITAYESPLRHKNGEIIWVSSNAKLIYDDTGKAIGVEGISRNITEQRETKQALLRSRDELELRVNQRTEQLSEKIRQLESLQAELRDSEQNFRALFENAVDSFLLHDVTGRILDANRHACESLGYSRAELMQLNITDIDIGPNPISFKEIIKTLANKESMQIEGIHRHKNASTFPVEVNLGLLHKGNEKLILALVRDITGRKQVEKLLINARDQAEQANQAKSEFLSRMSHELRTPLNAIVGFSDLLCSDPSDTLSPTQQDNVSEIYNAGQHLLNLIDDLLELSTIESGHIKIRYERINICELALDCVNMIFPQTGRKNILIRHNLHTCPATYIQIDATRLKQIIINLLSNAIKYNQSGSEITLGIETDTDTVRITVSDTGTGLTKQQQQRLFLPFERINQDVNIQGSGIGLNICKHLTELMGGKIGVNSKYRTGCQFWLEFPLDSHAAIVDFTHETTESD